MSRLVKLQICLMPAEYERLESQALLLGRDLDELSHMAYDFVIDGIERLEREREEEAAREAYGELADDDIPF